MSEHEVFYNDFINALQNNNAAVFAGAGLSVPAGFVDWKGLLKDVATELNIDISLEDDLISLAQHHVEATGGKSFINQKIINEFSKKIAVTNNHEKLAALNIGTFWTTNYDKLLEQSLSEKGHTVHVKYLSSHIPLSVPCTSVVYKMHGDVDTPHDTIITKKDFDNYLQTRGIFINTLINDLAQKTFLFAGISFNDPNILYVFTKVNELLGQAQRRHWYFIKKLSQTQVDEASNYLFQSEKQAAFVEKLKMWGLSPIWINEYSDITPILRDLEVKLLSKELDDVEYLKNDFQKYDRKLIILIDKYRGNSMLLEYCYDIYSKNKDHKTALSITDKQLAINPEDFYLYNTKGAILHNHFNAFKEAHECFVKSLLLNPDFSTAHINLGNNYWRLGNFKQSKYEYEQAILLEPENGDAHAGLGRVTMDLGQFSLSEIHLQKAVELDPGDNISYHNLGVLYHKHLINYELAEHFYQTSLSIDPNLIETLIAYGSLCKERLNKQLNARRLFEKALLINEKNYKPHYLLGIIFKENNDLIGAQVKFEMSLKLNPGLGYLHTNLGNVLKLSNEWISAKECFQKALELDPADASAWESLGAIYFFNEHDYIKAADSFEKVVEYDPENVVSFKNLGIIYGHLLNNQSRGIEMYDQAFATMNKAASRDLESLSLLQYFKGALLCEMKMYEASRTALEEALKLDDQNHEAKATLAIVLNNGFDDYNNAKIYLENALHFERSIEMGWYNYAVILNNLSLPDEALVAIEKEDYASPNIAEIIFFKAQILIRLQRFDDAASQLQQNIKNNTHIKSFYALSDLYSVNFNAFDKALDCIETLLDFTDDKEKAFICYADLLWKSASIIAGRNAERTIALIEEGINYNRRALKPLFAWIADKCYINNELNKALAYEVASLSYPPEDPSIHADILDCFAQRLYTKHNKKSAVDYFYQSIAIYPHAYTLNNLGVTLQELGFIKKARKCYLLALKFDRNYQRAIDNLNSL